MGLTGIGRHRRGLRRRSRVERGLGADVRVVLCLALAWAPIGLILGSLHPPAYADDFAPHCDNNATDLCIDTTDDSVFVADQQSGTVCHILSDGADDGTIPHPFGAAVFPTFTPVMGGIAYNSASDSLFILNRTAQSLFEFDKETGIALGGSITIIPPDPTRTLEGMTYDSIADTLWIRDVQNNALLEVGLDGIVIQTVDLPLSDQRIYGSGITFVDDGGTGYLDVTYGTIFECSAQRVMRVDTDGNFTGYAAELSGIEGEVGGIARIGINDVLAATLDQLCTVDTAQPSILPPTLLTCTSELDAAIVLNWQNHGTGVDGAYTTIEILRSENDGFSFSVIATIAGDATTYLDTEVATEESLQDITLQYRVRTGTGFADSFSSCSVYAGSGALVALVPFDGVTPYDMALNAAAGEIYITSTDGSGLISVYDNTLTFTGFIDTGLPFLRGIAYNSLQDTIVVSTATTGLLEEYDLIGTPLGACVTPIEDIQIGALSYDPFEDDYVYHNITDETLVRVDADPLCLCTLVGECAPPVVSGVDLGRGVAVIGPGTLLVTGDPGSFIQIDSETCFPGESVPFDGFGPCATEAAVNSLERVGNLALVALGETNSLAQILLDPLDDGFTRGDSDGNGAVELADVIHVAEYLFADGETPPCLDAADANDDGRLTISDAIYLSLYLFLGGAQPPEPFVAPGLDPTFLDSLGC